MSDATNDWTAMLPAALLKEMGLREKDVYRSVQTASAILGAIKQRREKIRLAKSGSEAEVQQDEKADEQIFLGAMVLLAARTKRGKP
jgi:antitoxin component of MazEF toxin-antitoxin module